MARPKKVKPQPPTTGESPLESDDQEATKEDMAHVRADELASSPDIWADKPAAIMEAAPLGADEPAAGGDEPTSAAPAAVEEPVVPPEPATEEAPAEASAAPMATMVAPPPPMAEPPPPAVRVPPSPAVRGGSGIALGVVLVVLGAFFLVIRVSNIDLTYGWPLYVIIPGLTLLVVGFASLRTGAAIPGGIVTMVGLVLAYIDSTGDVASWAFAWPLVAPGGVGLGLFLQGFRLRNAGMIRQGRNLMFAAALIFMVGFVFFESILNISGTDYGFFGRAALPALLIVLGIALLVRSMRSSRQA